MSETASVATKLTAMGEEFAYAGLVQDEIGATVSYSVESSASPGADSTLPALSVAMV